jgi:hypothetical protein
VCARGGPIRLGRGQEKRLDLINELRAAERYKETATTVEEKRCRPQRGVTRAVSALCFLLQSVSFLLHAFHPLAFPTPLISPLSLSLSLSLVTDICFTLTFV